MIKSDLCEEHKGTTLSNLYVKFDSISGYEATSIREHVGDSQRNFGVSSG